MELKEIQDLIKFVAKSGVSEVELESKGFKIVIKTPAGHISEPTHIQATVQAAPAVIAPIVSVQQTAPVVQQTEQVNSEAKYITIKSPMIGTFYRSAGPDKPIFVNIGDEIKPGKVTCIIEAMKLFNEIESDITGKIVKVLVNDASPVEYDQPLFLVDPS